MEHHGGGQCLRRLQHDLGGVLDVSEDGDGGGRRDAAASAGAQELQHSVERDDGVLVQLRLHQVVQEGSVSTFLTTDMSPSKAVPHIFS